ncbi:MAG: type I 3-dehydroquinate dehydratase [Candidatus Methanosuratus sp.]|nr:type I 3-dehydroquinate dehydratase [Candidatus Methanosuratincola sp.]
MKISNSSVRRYTICASATGRSEEEISRAAFFGEELGADLVELRLDAVEGIDREKVRAVFRMTEGIKVPRIATIMPSSIFGAFCGDPAQRGELLLEAADHADFVDVGVEIGPSTGGLLRRLSLKTKVILSWHAKELLPIEEVKRFVKSWSGCDVYKIAMPARRAEDNIRAMEASLALEGVRRIVFCYGDEGRASRLLSPLFGSEWVYGALRRDLETAPGQVEVEALKKIKEALS